MTSRFPFADRVRAVLFDAGNTLLWIDHARMARIASDAGTACDTAAMRRAEMLARPRLDGWLRTAPRRESPDTVARYIAAIGAGLPQWDDAAAEALRAAWPTLWCVPPDDALPTLDRLAARGLAIGCVSNSSGNVEGLLVAAGLRDRLACVVDSGVVGVEKPDPRIFGIACARLGVAPEDSVYLGDFLSLDVEGARRAGLHGVLLDPLGAWGGADVPRVASLTEFAARL